MKVRELMTETVRTCPVDATAADAAEVMWSHDVGVVPVVDPAGALEGIVTDRDLAMASLHKGMPLSRIRLAEVMTRAVQTCAPDDSLPAAADVMAAARVRRLPVVDDAGRLVGLLSMNDLARVAADSKSPSLARSVVGALGAISTKRLALPTLKAL